MYFLKLQEYILDANLEKRDWKRELSQAPYHLSIQENEDRGLYLLKYNQIMSDMSLQICQEARGVILDMHTLEVRAIGFNKFFNYGEKEAAEIDWASATIQEKVDGSIIKLFSRDSKSPFFGFRSYAFRDRDPLRMATTFPGLCGLFDLATNGMVNALETDLPMASLIQPDGGAAPLSFGHLVTKLIWDAFQVRANAVPGLWSDGIALNPEFTYIFEVVSPWNRVVVPYKEAELYFIGMRSNVDGHEVDLNDPMFETLHPELIHLKQMFKIPRTYGVGSTPEEIVAMTKSCMPMDTQAAMPGEGFVVCDSTFNRVKMKGEEYLAMHRLRGETAPTPKRIADMLRTDSMDDFLGAFPEYSAAFEPYQKALLSVTAKLEGFADFYCSWDSLQQADQKEYAIQYATPFFQPAFAFAVRKLDPAQVQSLTDHPSERWDFAYAWLQSLSLDRFLGVLQQEMKK